MGKWKFNPGDQVVVNEKGPGDYQRCQAIVVGRGPGTTEYTVNLDGQIVYLNSWWLDLVGEAPHSQQE